MKWKQFQILRQILTQTGADKLLTGFVGFVLVCALIFWLQEPGFQTFGDALWYCYAVITTIGFGDLIVQTVLARILSLVLSVYAVLVIAIVTGVVVNYYNQMVMLRQQESLTAILDRLERLPELSKEELEQLSEQIRRRHWKGPEEKA